MTVATVTRRARPATSAVAPPSSARTTERLAITPTGEVGNGSQQFSVSEQGGPPPVPPLANGTRELVPTGVTVTVNPSESDDFLRAVADICLPWQLHKAKVAMYRARLRELDAERHLTRARRAGELAELGHELAHEAYLDHLSAAAAASVSAERAYARAKGLARRLDTRVHGCESESALVWHCHACGNRHATPKRCGARSVCASCSAYRPGLTKRMRAGLGRALREARDRWNKQGRPALREPRLSLLTLSVVHSGDVEHDRRIIERGWARLRAWLAKVGAAHSGYLRTWELTRGDDGKGHVHVHVAILLPWLPLDELTEAWRRATDGAGEQANLARHRVGKRHASSRKTSASSAVSYVAKYVTKGSVSRAWGPDVAAGWVRASAGHRSYTTSRALLVREPSPHLCPGCGGDCAMVATHPMEGLAVPLGRVDARAGPRDPPGNGTSARVGLPVGDGPT